MTDLTLQHEIVFRLHSWSDFCLHFILTLVARFQLLLFPTQPKIIHVHKDKRKLKHDNIYVKTVLTLQQWDHNENEWENNAASPKSVKARGCGPDLRLW